MADHDKCPGADENCREDLVSRINGKIGWKSLAATAGLLLTLGLVFWNGYSVAEKDAAQERKDNKTAVVAITKDLEWIKQTQALVASKTSSMEERQRLMLELLRELKNNAPTR